MIQINTKSTLIPVRIGDLEFSFDLSDESIKKTHDEYDKFISNFDETPKDNDDAVKSLLDEGFSLFLGEGAFEKIYEKTPSTVICIEYLCSLSESLYEEMKNKFPLVSQTDVVKEYLNKKKIK